MSLLFSLLMKMDAGQAKAELRSLQGEMTKTGTGAKVLGAEAKGAGVGVDMLGDQSVDAAAQLSLLSAAQTRTAATAGQMQRSYGQAAGSVGNLVAQFNDIGMMMMAGQNPLQLAIQQGTQITQIIGPMGAAGAVRTLGGAFIGMLNPVNLATIGLIAGGAALVQWLTSAPAAAANVQRLASAYEDLAAAAESVQTKIDKLRFGVDEDFQVELLQEQIRLQAEFNAKKAELAGYEASTTDSVDRQRISTEALRAEISAIADKYNENAALLADQENRSATLAVIEGQRAQAAGETAARLRDAEAAAAQAALAVGDGVAAMVALTSAAPGGGWLSGAIGDAAALSATLWDAARGAMAAKAFTLGGDDERGSQRVQVHSGTGFTRDRLRTESGAGAGVSRGGGGGGGGGAAKAEKDAVAELIAKLREEQEVLRETDPIKLELMKHRKALATATAAERTEVENLIRAEQQLKAVRAAEDFASQSAADFLDAIIVRGESAEQALKSLLSSLIKVGIQALMLGQGPLAGVLGTSGGIFSGIFGGGARLPFMAAGGLVTGAGGPRDDKVPIWASAGEFMVNGRATAQYRPLLERINAGGGVPGFATGGMVGAARATGGASVGFGGSSTARGDTHIHVYGAKGNSEIREMVQAGVEAGIEANNTHVLPDRVLGILSSPRIR